MASEAEKLNCKRKRRFNNDVEAQAALKRINPGKASRGPSRVYKCQVCGGYHLSSKPKL